METSGSRGRAEPYDDTALGVGRSPWEGVRASRGRVRGGLAPLPRTCLLSEALTLHLPPVPRPKHPDSQPLRGCLKRTMFPAGSRKAQSRTP